MAEEDYEGGWQTMESDPGVFTELLKTLGVDSLIVDDLYSLDAESLERYKPIHAFIFLFKWVGGGDETGGASGAYDHDFPGFFANQVVNNACATIAVMNGILNIPNLEVGEGLQNLKEFAQALDPKSRGEVITSDLSFRTAHNSLSPPPSVSLADLDIQRDKSGDAYHFIVYLPYAGSIYELDGLKSAPIRHGAYSEAGEGWVAKAREVVEARIATYPPESLHFNLLAIRDDPLPKLEEQARAAHDAGNASAAADLALQISVENEKRKQWAFDNSLRRHNHLGIIHAILLEMAKAELLDEAVRKAKTKMTERIAAARAKGGDADMES